MSIPLNQILALVGKLDDSPGQETARERFRGFLRDNVHEVGEVRDYINECLRNSGDQYSRALQDLVNYLGQFLGFEVVFGRYQGVQGQVGFDGHWRSPSGLHIVIEVKTTEVYAIKTKTLVGYVDELISEGAIPNWDSALGMYVIGRPDPELRQLENAIEVEKRTNQLRIISAESLLSLADITSAYDAGHGDVLALIRPSGPRIDPVVDLITRLVAAPKSELAGAAIESGTVEVVEISDSGQPTYWLTPVKSDEEQSADECVKALVGKEHIYAFGERAPGRKHLKHGDWICFYATTKGVIAHARVDSAPEKKPHPKVRHPETFPWTFRLKQVALYPDQPVVVDADMRQKLEAFKGRDPGQSWAWFVQATHKLVVQDFRLLTRDDAGKTVQK